MSTLDVLPEIERAVRITERLNVLIRLGGFSLQRIENDEKQLFGYYPYLFHVRFTLEGKQTGCVHFDLLSVLGLAAHRVELSESHDGHTPAKYWREWQEHPLQKP